MNNTWNYFRIEAKRSLKLIANSIVSLIILVAVTIAGVWGIHTWIARTSDFERITVGIGLDEGDNTTKLFARIVGGMDSVQAVCRFEYMTIDEAKEKVSTDEIEVAILLPEDFYEDVDTGVNTPVSVLFAKDCKFNVEVFAELLGDGVSLVQITEAGVYAATDLGYEYDMTMRRGKMQEFLSMLYLEAAYGRGKSFDECILSETGEVNMNQYYMVVAMLFLVLMGGVVFSFFYQKRNKAVEERLRFMGVGPIKQSLIKLFFMTMYVYVGELLCLIVALVASAKTDWIHVEFEPFQLMALLLLAISIAAFFHGIYGIFMDKGSLGLIVMNAIMFVCAGGFVPAVYFPKWIQRLGSIMPLFYWMDYLQKVFFGDDYSFPILPLLVVTLIFGIVGTVSKCVRT